jgi:hypothetical protein
MPEKLGHAISELLRVFQVVLLVDEFFGFLLKFAGSFSSFLQFWVLGGRRRFELEHIESNFLASERAFVCFRNVEYKVWRGSRRIFAM